MDNYIKRTKQFNKANSNFRKGKYITNKEVLLLHKTYTTTEQHLAVLGESYHFAWLDAVKQQRRLTDMANERNLEISGFYEKIDYLPE